MSHFDEELNASPFTRAIQCAKPEINALTAQRNYLAIRDLKKKLKAEVEEDKLHQQEAIVERQRLERERLEKAHQVTKEKTREEAKRNVEEITKRFTTHAEFHAARQARHLDQFEQSVRAVESKRPLVYSTVVRDLLQAEAHLVKLHQYDDAEFAKRKIGSTARVEKKSYRENVESRVQTRVESRRDVLKAASDYMNSRCRNEISMAQHRAVEAEKLIDKRFEHTFDDMSHAHRLELRQNALLKNLQCPPQMRRRKELYSSKNDAASGAGSNSTSAALAQKAARGTEALRRAVGSRYEVPSLCDSYGSLLEKNVRTREDNQVELPRCASRE